MKYLISIWLIFFLMRMSHVNWISFPGGCSKESACQCRRYKFDPLVGKISWRKKWQLTPVFLFGKSHGQRRLVG